MKKYRIIEYNNKGDTHYIVEEKGWVFWHSLCSGPENTIDTFYSLEEVNKAIQKDALGSFKKIIVPDTSKFEKSEGI